MYVHTHRILCINSSMFFSLLLLFAVSFWCSIFFFSTSTMAVCPVCKFENDSIQKLEYHLKRSHAVLVYVFKPIVVMMVVIEIF